VLTPIKKKTVSKLNRRKFRSGLAEQSLESKFRVVRSNGLSVYNTVSETADEIFNHTPYDKKNRNSFENKPNIFRLIVLG